MTTTLNFQNFGTFGDQIADNLNDKRSNTMNSLQYFGGAESKGQFDEFLQTNAMNKNDLRTAIDRQHSRNIKSIQDQYIDTIDSASDNYTHISNQQTLHEKESLLALRKTIDDRLSELEEISRTGSVMNLTAPGGGSSIKQHSRVGSSNHSRAGKSYQKPNKRVIRSSINSRLSRNSQISKHTSQTMHNIPRAHTQNSKPVSPIFQDRVKLKNDTNLNDRV